MDLIARVHEVGATTQVTDTFKKRDLIVEYAENPQYPEFVKFEAVQDKIDKLDPLGVGDTVKVHFNLRGRPYTDKAGKTTYFNTLSVWKIEVIEKSNQTNLFTPPVAEERPPF